ncbi:MAG: hypothetical protein KBS58_06870 [Bacteroidales bacterium]|nr:hypothetical protein [Candidatus Cacconaster equi]
MNRIAVVAAAMLFSLSLCSAQNFVYTITCGDSQSKVTFIPKKDAPMSDLTIRMGTQEARHLMDKNNCTTSWHVADKSANTDITVTLSDGYYYLKGTFKGTAFDKKIKSDGTPWYQHIGYVAGHVLKKGEKITFTCVRPTDMKIFPMTAEIIGTEAIGKHKDATCVRVSPAGAFARFWKSYYYFNPKTLDFVGYHAVEGGPGTPESFWVLD